MLAAAPWAAHANAGIGFFTPAAVSLVLALIPVVLVEGAILSWRLRLGVGRGQWVSFCANLFSTFAGGIAGLAADFAIGSATGSLGGGGRGGFLVSLFLMFWVSWWLEAIIVRRMSRDAPAGAAGRATLLANGATYAMLAVGIWHLVPPDPYALRSRMTEVINVAGVERMEATEHYQAHGRFKAVRKDAPTQHVRRVTVDESGRIVAEIAYPRDKEVDGKTVVYEPVLKEGRIVGWRCYVPEAPLKYFPAACRFRSAAEAAPF